MSTQYWGMLLQRCLIASVIVSVNHSQAVPLSFLYQVGHGNSSTSSLTLMLTASSMTPLNSSMLSQPTHASRVSYFQSHLDGWAIHPTSGILGQMSLSPTWKRTRPSCNVHHVRVCACSDAKSNSFIAVLPHPSSSAHNATPSHISPINANSLKGWFTVPGVLGTQDQNT